MSPSLFISYRQENPAHSHRVRELALKLRAAGIEVTHDGLKQEEEFYGNQPQNGWGIWSTQQASTATSVLIIGSEGWFRVINSPEPTADGKGAAAEATCIHQRLFKGGAVNDFAVIGFFDYAHDLKTLPLYFDAKCGRFDLLEDDHFNRLVQWLKRPIATPSAVALPASPPSPIPADISGPDFPPAVPPLDRAGFIDCRSAFNAFEQLLAPGAPHRILLLEAEGEHGKSTLIRRFWEHARNLLPQNSAALLTFPEIPDTVEAQLGLLTDQLGGLTPAGANTYERTRALLTVRAGLPTVIFIDHFERGLPEHADWLGIFLNRAITQPLLRLVIAGRRVPAPATQPWGIYAIHVPCDPFAEPEAFVEYAVAQRSTLSPEHIRACCGLMRSQRDARKQKGQPLDGLSPLAVLAEIQKYCPGGATA